MEAVATLVACYVHWTATCDKTAGVLCTLEGIAGSINLEVSKKSCSTNLMHLKSLCPGESLKVLKRTLTEAY
jgi:hypothetical protein